MLQNPAVNTVEARVAALRVCQCRNDLSRAELACRMFVFFSNAVGIGGVYPCFDSADSLARVRMLRAVSCRVHSVTLAWPTFYRKDSLASGESHGIRFRDSAQKTKDPADAEHRPSARESVASAGYVSMQTQRCVRRSNHTLPM